MNNIILAQQTQKSMTSLEISELVQSRHYDVKRSIERLAKKGVIQLPPTAEVENIQSLSPNKMIDCYIFSGEQGKLDSITVVAQLSPHFTARLVKRWYELENAQQFNPADLSRLDILQIALQAEKENQVLKQQAQLNEPKVQHYDRVVERKHLQNATQVAQKLGLSAMAMNRYLDHLDVYNHNIKRGRVFKQWFVDMGLGEMKQTDLGHSQPLFTNKGEAWVIEKLTSEGVV